MTSKSLARPLGVGGADVACARDTPNPSLARLGSMVCRSPRGGRQEARRSPSMGSTARPIARPKARGRWQSPSLAHDGVDGKQAARPTRGRQLVARPRTGVDGTSQRSPDRANGTSLTTEERLARRSLERGRREARRQEVEREREEAGLGSATWPCGARRFLSACNCTAVKPPSAPARFLRTQIQ